MKSELIEIRTAYVFEKEDHNAQVAIVRRKDGKNYRIWARFEQGKWKQWGPHESILRDNVEDLKLFSTGVHN